MMKTFIESSQLKSDIGIRFMSRAHKTSDDFTYLGWEGVHLCVHQHEVSELSSAGHHRQLMET